MILKLILVLLSFIFAYLFSILPRRSMRRRMEKYHQTMFAHRGYHCIEKGIPENSMSSFQAAVDHNYGIELVSRILNNCYIKQMPLPLR